jgi:hypothetical protein
MVLTAMDEPVGQLGDQDAPDPNAIDADHAQHFRMSVGGGAVAEFDAREPHLFVESAETGRSVTTVDPSSLSVTPVHSPGVALPVEDLPDLGGSVARAELGCPGGEPKGE